jgi:hypothetical protein
MTTPHEIALLRLVAQGIAGPRRPSAVDVVRWLTAVQAQDLPGAMTSVALRLATPDRASVVTALDAGEVVRSWPMRGTLHLVAAEDLVWLVELLAQRVVNSSTARQAQLGLDGDQLERARSIAVDALSGGRRLRRTELMAAWESAGLSTAGQRGYHLIAYLAQTGTLCFGPMDGSEQLLVLVEEWVRHPRRLDRDEALGELALRFFRSHGPATAKDLARWGSLTAADVRTGIATARPELARLEVDGVEHLLDPRTPELLAAHRRAARGVFLLPGFDELVLGYQDRTAVVPAAFANAIVPGGNGVFRATVVADGTAVGTWQHTGKGDRRSISATPFTTFTAAVEKAIPRVYAALPR